MQHDEKQLHLLAQDYPWFMFTVEEIASLCNVSRDFVSKVRGAIDSPFCLNKCRPEWFADWMRQHPDFQLTKDMDAGVSPLASNPQVPGRSASRVRQVDRVRGKKASQRIATVGKRLKA
jgi:hypothetical protein